MLRGGGPGEQYAGFTAHRRAGAFRNIRKSGTIAHRNPSQLRNPRGLDRPAGA